MKNKELLRFLCVGIIIMIIFLSFTGCKTNTNPNNNTDSVIENNTEELKGLKQVAEENYYIKKSKLLELVRTNNSSQSLTKRVNKDDYYSELIKTDPTGNRASYSLISDKGGIMDIGCYISGFSKPIMKITVLYSNVSSSSDYKCIIGISVNLVEEMHFASIAVKDTTDAVYLMQWMVVPIVPYVNLIGLNKYTIESYTSNFTQEANTSGAIIFKNKSNGVLCKIYISKNNVDASLAVTNFFVEFYDSLLYNTNGESFDYDSLNSSSTSSDQNSRYYNEAVSSILKENYTTAYQYLRYVSLDYKNSKELKAAINAVIKAEKYMKAVECYENGEYDRINYFLNDLGEYLDSAKMLEAVNKEIENKYLAAIDMYNNKEYDKAKTAFVAMNGYRESDKFVELCNTGIKQNRYDEAVALYNQGKYEEAKVIFAELSDFNDSTDYIGLCDNGILQKSYDEAVVLYNNGKYYEAKNVFQSLNDFGDSKAYITKCENGIKEDEYQTAVELYNKGEFEKAKTAFLELKGYSESIKYIELCNTELNKIYYDDAIALFNNGKYEEAKAAFQKLNGYSDSKVYITKCENAIKEKEYQSAIALYNSGNYEKAKKAFANFGNYKDSNSYLEKCKKATHVHTNECKKWVVDVPYKPAVYKKEKVVDIPYSPAEYGDIPYETYDYYYTVMFYASIDSLSFTSTEQFEKWIKDSGATLRSDINSGKVVIDGGTYNFDYTKYNKYKVVKYEYGLIKAEQPEVSHLENILVSPEQKEQGHYEYICGY